jgi:ABC-type lipoprotein release transport system permease subunit
VSTEEAKKAFTEACHKYIPTTFDIKINSFKDIIYESEKGNRFLLHACYLLTFISLLVVVLSIYSSISLDATTRQKEISLRKINGAHRKDIFKHFVSPYIITYTVTFIIIYPQLAEFISWQVDNAHNYDEIFSTGRMIVYAILVFVGTIALLAITSWHKIRMIMNINPADVIRKE